MERICRRVHVELETALHPHSNPTRRRARESRATAWGSSSIGPKFIRDNKAANAATLEAIRKKIMLVNKKALVAATFLTLCSGHAEADGALAMTPPDHFVTGFTSAYVVDAANVDAASSFAMLKCRQNDRERQLRLSAPILRDRCKVVKVFHHQCFAVAVDETNGQGSGAGWAVEDNLSIAESKALGMCRTNAVLGRQDLCQVAKWSCDRAPTTDHVGGLPQ